MTKNSPARRPDRSEDAEDRISTQIQLVSRPTGWPTEENFRTVEVELPELARDQVRVRNEFVSVDPYMRGRMIDQKSYVAPYRLGETMDGGAVGRVIASTSPRLPEGTLVLHNLGWRDLAQDDAAQFRTVPELEGLPDSLYLSMLGMTGLTAFTGLTRAGQFRPGDTVFVSGAAGAVGTAVGQIARLLGAGRVIGSAGSEEKVRLLTQKYGYDAAFNYKDAPVRRQLAEIAPEGIDLYYDNVGGEHLEAALDVLNRDGRVALCGAISLYNEETRRPGPDNMANIIKNSLTLHGFTVADYMDSAEEFNARMSAWMSDGQIAYDETVVDGLDHAVQAFIDMMGGANTGKMVVRI